MADGFQQVTAETLNLTFAEEYLKCTKFVRAKPHELASLPSLAWIIALCAFDLSFSVGSVADLSAGQPHSARLRPFLAHLFGEMNFVANF